MREEKHGETSQIISLKWKRNSTSPPGVEKCKQEQSEQVEVFIPSCRITQTEMTLICMASQLVKVHGCACQLILPHRFDFTLVFKLRGNFKTKMQGFCALVLCLLNKRADCSEFLCTCSRLQHQLFIVSS